MNNQTAVSVNSTKSAKKWNKKYQNSTQEVLPCSVLNDYAYLLPGHGKALDLACGLGGNAFYMAEQGLSADAVDISQVAINAVNEKAQREKVAVKGVIRDVETTGLADDLYDVIVVSYFLHRAMIPEIISHLAPSGLLFYQTWTKEKVLESGSRNPDFLLDKGELLAFCKGMDILHYHEEGLVGDREQGTRNIASIIATH